MSKLSDQAILQLILADYVNADSTGKINVLGGGISVVSAVRPPEQSFFVTGPLTLALLLRAPRHFIGTTAQLSVSLETAQGSQVTVPDTVEGPFNGSITFEQALDIGDFTGSPAPPDTLPARVRWLMMFATGLPIGPGNYTWRAMVDGVGSPNWEEPFTVVAADEPTLLNW